MARALILGKGYRDKDIAEIARESQMAFQMSGLCGQCPRLR